jgi:hypothetical protein
VGKKEGEEGVIKRHGVGKGEDEQAFLKVCLLPPLAGFREKGPDEACDTAHSPGSLWEIPTQCFRVLLS